MSPPSWGGGSESLSAGGVDRVGYRLLGVAAVVVDLEEDGEVHEDLQETANPELHGGLCEQEVGCLEGVTAGPHEDHLDTAGKGGTRSEGSRESLQASERLSADAPQLDG